MNTHKKPEHGSLEWLTLRHKTEEGKTRFGASEAPTLMGVSPFKSLADMAIEKWGAPEVREQTPAMTRGHILEPALVAYAETLLGEKVIVPDLMFSNGRLIATLDGEAIPTIVEAKTSLWHSADDALPAEWYWQGIAQMACIPEAEQVMFVVLDKRMNLGHWILKRDENAIADLIIRAEEIGEMLDNGIMPPDAEIKESHIKLLYPEGDGTKEIGARGLDAVNRFSAWKSQREIAEKHEQEARDEITALLADCAIGTLDGQIIVTYKSRSTGSRLDTKRLEQEHPELVAQYKKAAGSTRVLKVG